MFSPYETEDKKLVRILKLGDADFGPQPIFAKFMLEKDCVRYEGDF